MPYHSAELVEVVVQLGRRLGDLQAEIAGLRFELRQFGVGQATDGDSALVAAIHAALGDRVFSSAGLLGRALRVDGPGMRLAALLGGRSVRGVGRLLGAAVGKATPAGLALRSAGSSRAGLVWCIRTHG